MSKSPRSPADQLIAKLRADFADLTARARSSELTPQGRKKLSLEIERSASEMNALLAELDLVKRPKTLFDPGNPRTIGFFIAVALTAQQRRPLDQLEQFYGAGVYAIYYKGDYPLYKPLKNTETPIYVGQAAPASENARTPLEQGLRLAARLNEHRKNIERANTLRIKDFEYRALVVQTGWETGAENYLIRIFRPIWNSETKLVFGLGKHGDSAETRRNKRSPWDTLHAGRNWAGADSLKDAKSEEIIAAELAKHFAATRVYRTINDVLAGFVDTLSQA
jgi:hypothetical protein